MIGVAQLVCLLAIAPASQGSLLATQNTWSRDSRAIKVKTVQDTSLGEVVEIEHTGNQDWSLPAVSRLTVSAGERIEISAFLRCEGTGNIELCAVAYENGDKVRDWSLGGKSLSNSPEWKFVRTRFVVPVGVVSLMPRVIGYGPSKCGVRKFSVQRLGSVDALRPKGLPATLAVQNKVMKVVLDTHTLSLKAALIKSKQTWEQGPTSNLVLTEAITASNAIKMKALDPSSDQALSLRLELDPKLPEYALTIEGSGDMPNALAFPQPFQTRKGENLIIPMNEGISFPVEDQSIEPMHLIAYGGHGICMPFWGQTDGQSGAMAIFETPDDARISIERQSGLLRVAPIWESQKGLFGYARRIRYVLFDKGGHVAMCKRYRAYAKKTGLLVTLAEKRKKNPNVDKLVGAVNIWNWDADPVAMCQELQKNGIKRILWSRGGNAEQIKALNELGVLTSRYDIFQDVMDPAQYPKLQWTHPDWTEKGWPKDLMIGPNGDWIKGWEVETKDGKMIPCGVLCDKQAPAYANERIGNELKKIPYACRFIDTTTASPWRECYSPNHPVTRTESKKTKMDLLSVVSKQFNLITGCETGHDASVPYLHYFEGMMSLGPYRVPDSGRAMDKIWTEVPEVVSKFQLGHRYRLPLWELVYHDCVVAQWYWGDYNNKLPDLWAKRDQFNALYGNGPMFMFNKALWQSDRLRFIQSYRRSTEVARLTGYSEMTDHRFLTPNCDVQQTVFANGVKVTVNFGTATFEYKGKKIEPGGMLIER